MPKKLKWVFLFFVSAIAMSALLKGLDYFDSGQREALHLLLTSKEVIEQVGVISDYSLHKRYYIGHGGQTPPYREYLYLAKGEKMRAFVTIRMDGVNEGQRRYSVTRIQEYP